MFRQLDYLVRDVGKYLLINWDLWIFEVDLFLII